MRACLLRFMRTATRYDELYGFVVLPPLERHEGVSTTFVACKSMILICTA